MDQNPKSGTERPTSKRANDSLRVVDAKSVPRIRVYNRSDLQEGGRLTLVPKQLRWEAFVVSAVLPFKVNNHVVHDLIDWSNVPDDPVYRMMFPRREMLEPEHYAAVEAAIQSEASDRELQATVDSVRSLLNPHPAAQTSNIPQTADGRLPGLQHKYSDTLLVFPRQGQTCHSYCNFCFRWPQFVRGSEHRFVAREAEVMHEYAATHTDLTDVLLTGGDPMVMSSALLESWIEPLLGVDHQHIETIRIGTKALTFWPYRFTVGQDADRLLRLIDRVVSSGKQMAIMAHFNHWRELTEPVAIAAIKRLRGAGAIVRGQGPLLRGVTDDADSLARLLSHQLRNGVVPYYVFVERDTGPNRYYEIPLADALQAFDGAMAQSSGLASTVRGPVMSADIGKVRLDGTTTVKGQRAFRLTILRARHEADLGRQLLACFDERATWLSDLRALDGTPLVSSRWFGRW